MRKEKLYFCFPLSGPNNGVKIISSYILTDFLKDDSFDLRAIDTAQSKGFSNFGKFNFNKFIDTLSLFSKLLNVKHEDLIYLNLTPQGFAFFRDFCMILICKIKRGNVTVHVHANGLEKKINPLTRYLLKGVKIVVINHLQYNKLKSLNSNLYLVKNALPDFAQQPLKMNTFDENKIKLLFFSNLSKQKGVFRLVSLIESIGKTNLNCEVNIYGGILDQSHETILKTLKCKYDFTNYFGPIIDEKEKYKAFQANDFLLFLSDENYEVSPLVFIEALMSGLPIITTKQVVSKEIIDKKCGFHISDNSKELISILQRYRSNESNHNTMRVKCRKTYLENYSFENFMKEIKTIIEK